MSVQTVRWGIIGPGRIAEKFARDIRHVEGAEITAVGSREMSRARRFAEIFAVPQVYGSYEQVANDPAVDAVYIATPHPMHFENARICLEAGKHVLCEKPMTVNAAESRQLIELARSRSLFLMEALWTRYLPVVGTIKAWIEAGRIGDIRLIQSTFGFKAPRDLQSRVFNPDLAGGALLDIGIYPIAVSQYLLNANPLNFSVEAQLGETGVDELIAVNLNYPGEIVSQFTATVQAALTNDCTIYGTAGKIQIEPMFWYPAKATLHSGNTQEVVEVPLNNGGFEYETGEACRCIREGLTESPHMTHADTLANMELMDAIREKIGLKYPFES